MPTWLAEDMRPSIVKKILELVLVLLVLDVLELLDQCIQDVVSSEQRASICSLPENQVCHAAFFPLPLS